MIVAVADTHTVIWYLFQDSRLSSTAQSFIEQAVHEGNQIAFSSITLAEIVYLSERNRIPAATLSKFLGVVNAGQSVWVEVPIEHRVVIAMQMIDRAQIPELADRIIAATAVHCGVPVITRDHKIQASSISTIW
ncbi:MAG: PIN domain protein [Alkalinema sp. CACIAM 70d]|nr:MAG: PIN domain protein [Alkalinema sp. CACIAM 70d]